MSVTKFLNAAEKERPDLLEKVAAAIEVLEHTDPEGADELIQEIQEIAQYTQEKTAAVAEGVRGFAGALAGTLVAGVGAALATDLYDAARRGLTKSRNYRAILAANPELKRVDPQRLRDTYSAIHQYAPEFTSNPIVGGAILANVANSMPGQEHVMVRDLIKSRKDLIDAKGRQYSPGNISYSPARDTTSLADLENLRHTNKKNELADLETLRHNNKKSELADLENLRHANKTREMMLGHRLRIAGDNLENLKNTQNEK